MRIIACVEHTRYEGLDFTPIEPQEEGHVLADSILVNGTVHLDCYFCSWATPGQVLDKKVEAVLKSVGHPSERQASVSAGHAQIQRPKARMASEQMKKEKNVAREKSTEPKKRDRTPKKSIVSRKFGPNIEVAVYLKGGTIEDVLALPEAERTALFDLLKSIKAETPKGA